MTGNTCNTPTRVENVEYYITSAISTYIYNYTSIQRIIPTILYPINFKR